MRAAAALLVAVALAGCSAIRDVARDVQARSVRFEVWNRTLDDVTLTDGNGVTLAVRACGHATAGSFRVDMVRVHTTVGYVWGFGSGGDAETGEQYLVIVAADGESFPTQTPPVALPACAGHLNAQPGVFLNP